METNIDIETNDETDEDDDSDGTQCETDEDHEIDYGAVNIFELDRDEVCFELPCSRCGAWAHVHARRPKIEWGDSE